MAEISPPRPLQKHEDSRGWVVEALRPDYSPELRGPFGQIHLSFAHAGQAKANHYHAKRREWFVAVRGAVQAALQPLDPTGKPLGPVHTFTLSADEPALLEIAPCIAHAFKAINGPATIMAYATEPYDPKNPDTFPFVLLKPEATPIQISVRGGEPTG